MGSRGVGVKAGAQENEIGFDFFGSVLKGILEHGSVLGSRGAETDRDVGREAQARASKP